MVRLYGKAPYTAVLVHGGPGAGGSLKGFAEELSGSAQIGVVEAIQSKYSIAELIDELYDQISDNCTEQISLVGHSWGAWLAVLFAEKYPELVKNIILVGCAPLEDKYVSEICSRRLLNLSDKDREIFQRLVSSQAADGDMTRVSEILDRADNYCLIDREKHEADKTDNEMYNKVWSEAARLRSSGELLASFKKIKNRIYLIQGEDDPHPAKGVIIPLQENGVLCESYLLKKCGHSPFMEKYAKKEFYNILLQICR